MKRCSLDLRSSFSRPHAHHPQPFLSFPSPACRLLFLREGTQNEGVWARPLHHDLLSTSSFQPPVSPAPLSHPFSLTWNETADGSARAELSRRWWLSTSREDRLLSWA